MEIETWYLRQITMENGPVEIVDFPMNSMGGFSIAFCMFTRGYLRQMGLSENRVYSQL